MVFIDRAEDEFDRNFEIYWKMAAACRADVQRSVSGNTPGRGSEESGND
jgi:hypothetical protein